MDQEDMDHEQTEPDTTMVTSEPEPTVDSGNTGQRCNWDFFDRKTSSCLEPMSTANHTSHETSEGPNSTVKCQVRVTAHYTLNINSPIFYSKFFARSQKYFKQLISQFGSTENAYIFYIKSPTQK